MHTNIDAAPSIRYSLFAPLSRKLHLDRRAAPERLIDYAIALGELEQLIELVLRRVALEIKSQSNLRESHRRRLVDPERAAKIDVAFRRYRGGLERDVERGRHRLEGDAGAGNERLEQHVPRTEFEP